MNKRSPDFENNLLKILKKEKPQRATLFEIFLNDVFYKKLAGEGEFKNYYHMVATAFANAGYDYMTWKAPEFKFRQQAKQMAETRSLNGQSLITDRKSFESFNWPDPENVDYSVIYKAHEFMPDGMKLMVMGPSGVLELAIDLVGYDSLCVMLYEDPELVQEIFYNIGTRLLKYYEICSQGDYVGFICSNDDWGFNSQTFLSPSDMRKYVFPWHKKIVEASHRYNKPVILHSCGYYDEIISDVVYDMKYDARHSYEDNITPIEIAYKNLCDKTVVLGGIDMNFLVTKTPEEIYKRAKNMLKISKEKGNYALGSGNSIPEYVPFDNFMAMNNAAIEFEW